MINNSVVLIIIGCLFSVSGLIFFIKGIGDGNSSKVKFFGAEVESSAPSLVIFVIGATLIFYGARNKAVIAPPLTSTINSQMDSIGSTGWIFLGYYDFKIHNYTEHPTYATDRTSYAVISDSLNLHKGDILALLRERKVVIVQYKINKLSQVLNPPLANLDSNDYTNVKLPVGTRVKVEDISITNFPGDPYAVWARIRLE